MNFRAILQNRINRTQQVKSKGQLLFSFYLTPFPRSSDTADLSPLPDSLSPYLASEHHTSSYLTSHFSVSFDRASSSCRWYLHAGGFQGSVLPSLFFIYILSCLKLSDPVQSTVLQLPKLFCPAPSLHLTSVRM